MFIGVTPIVTIYSQIFSFIEFISRRRWRCRFLQKQNFFRHTHTHLHMHPQHRQTDIKIGYLIAKTLFKVFRMRFWCYSEQPSNFRAYSILYVPRTWTHEINYIQSFSNS